MVKHIVLFKLHNPTPESVAEAKAMLLSMDGKVPELRSIEVGSDFLHSARSYDLGLIVTVEDREALERYQSDPYHAGVVKPYMHSVREGSVALDYEI